MKAKQMHRHKICIFGYGNHGKFIARGLDVENFDITIVESNKEYYQNAKNDGFENVYLLDVTNDDEIKTLTLTNDTQLVCVMDDEHLNVFLTLSLRSLYKDIYILSISDSINVTKKLKMAGANKVIDLYEVSANKIYNILDRPVATGLLEEFVLNKKGITFKEMVIPKGSFLDGKMVDDIDFASYEVLLVGMIDEEMGHSFVFITAGIEHKLDSGDTMVCIGYSDKLKEFEKLIAQTEEKL
jgi:voltage-gated potassium channel